MRVLDDPTQFRFDPHRYDFTPCFIDVWVASVAAFGIIVGGIAIAWLVKHRTSVDVPKNWHFWLKQSLLAAVIVSFALQLGIQIVSFPGIWFGDFRVWSTVATIASLAVIYCIQWLEHTRLRNPNGVALFYWLFLLIALAVKLRSLISQQLYDTDIWYFATYATSCGLSVAAFLAEWNWPESESRYEALVDEEECPLETATVFSRLTFSWMTPLMRYGYKQYLTEDDLWALARTDNTKTTGDAFDDAWRSQLKYREKPSLWRTMGRAYGGPYAVAAIFKIGNDVAQYVQPQLLRLLITFVKSYQAGNTPQPVIQGAAIAMAMFATAVFQTSMVHQYFQTTFVTGMRIKGGLASAIYRKSMRLSNEGRSSKTTGDIVNYMAVDAQRLQDLAQFLHQIWSSPFQIILCMVSLYQLVGWSMFAGIAVMIIMVPLNGWISTVMRTLQKKQMKNKDARSRLITEIINNMKSIKLYAWSAAFMNKLNYVRNEQELKNLRRIGATQALANFAWNTAPFFVSCSTFTVFVLTQDRPLSTEIVFPALALFNLLTFPLAVLPMVITAMVEASVAVTRLTDFLAAEEIQPDAVIVKPSPDAIGDETVIIREGSFSWNRHESKVALHDIDFTAYKGQLSCVVGRVGAGKSSLLQSMLGDLWKVNGRVEVHGTVAYVAQQPWILNATVKENIIFGYRYESHFYELTVKACALLDDFAQLPDGDETVVGERGISLSGGQKARVALARAVYARADVYLLDDVLSAVDSHVGRHIIENVLGPRGLLHSRTRVLATNAISVLQEASHITLIKDGSIAEKGTFQELMIQKGLVADLVKTARQDQARPSSDTASSASGSESATVHEADLKDSDRDALDTAGEPVPEAIHAKDTDGKKRAVSFATLRRPSAASFKGPRGKLTDEEVASSRTKQVKEHLEQGKVKWDVYIEYAKANDLVAVGIYLFALFASQCTSVGGSIWLKKWSDANSRAGSNPDIGKFIGIYFAFGVGASALSVVQTLILWIFCSIEKYYLRTSRELKRLDSVSRSPIYAHFQETLGGVSTIRAYRQQDRFGLENEWRIDANLQAYFPSISANRWLAIRLEFIGAIVILSAAGFAVMAVASGVDLSPGMVGLAMSYALQIVTSLNWIVRQTVEVETNIVSVERVLEYTRLPSEAPEIIAGHRPPVAWPAQGALTFNGFSTRYREGLDLVLKNINLDIKNIAIDNLNTSTIGLLDLRRRLAIIPQDAALFEGTVRDNLDPGHVHDDTELWSVLEHARLKDHISSMDGGLEAKINEGGSNLSQGQRQLVSLARAMLTPSNILVLDEATAAVDVQTDVLLQATLRSPMFANRTIITVAHRINTIMDSDRVVVLDKGEVVEFDTPQELIKRQGFFYKLVKQAGIDTD
ncbi:unnamed protein product [Parascedosporium putredinis]|uniref:Metal resistance protein YCF1 n=1 Tax=Parascedosporium putredinis TaxID=1442378 RepID=A0A9P1H761_9PEZI|nr:unnamed protein product [Parascedosporium putredinis]CAI8000966.1 unnamed protein product [Parascedosporium putredinis]